MDSRQESAITIALHFSPFHRPRAHCSTPLSMLFVAVPSSSGALLIGASLQCPPRWCPHRRGVHGGALLVGCPLHRGVHCGALLVGCSPHRGFFALPSSLVPSSVGRSWWCHPRRVPSSSGRSLRCPPCRGVHGGAILVGCPPHRGFLAVPPLVVPPPHDSGH